MKIHCSYSSIEYTVEHFPASLYLGSGEVHPVFALPQKKLLSLLPKYYEGGLTETDSYLLFLALLNSTSLLQWNAPAIRSNATSAIVAANIQHLAEIVGKINAIKHPAFALPTFVIGADTRDLANVKYWLEIWDKQYAEWLDGCRDAALLEKLHRRERALEKLIKNPAINPAKYAGMLADWAATAAAFPTFRMQSPLTGECTTLAAYWKEIITRCYKSESIISVPSADLNELLTHCEENIEAGSIFSFHLFSTLREGKERQSNFLGFSLSLSNSNPGFNILQDGDTDVEAAALQLLINSAPAEEPTRAQYPTAFAFLKAKMKWDLACKHQQHQQQKDNKE